MKPYSYWPVIHTIRRWWILLLEGHYLMSADIEDHTAYKSQNWREADEARQNASYFMMKAAETRAKINAILL